MHAFSALSKRWQIDRCRRELSFNQSTIHLNKRTSVSPINRTTNESCMLISTNCRMYFERRATFDQWCQFSLLPSLLLFSSILQKIISAVKSHFKFKMKVLCKQVFVLALCQYDTALMIIALNGKIYRIWSGRKGNSRGIIKKKSCIWSLWFWVPHGHKILLETFCWCFGRLSSGTPEIIKFLLNEPSYTIWVSCRELLRHHKFFPEAVTENFCETSGTCT